ncbi:MAG: glycosyltransferase [Acetobacteraceae bacterium]|nr:glycosyltransferase [Acetobacteraceae bacterium]
MNAPCKVLLISLGHPDLVPGGSPVVCQELFDELRTRDDIECHMLAAVDRESGDVHQPKEGITGFDGRDGVYLLHQTDHDAWLHRNNEPMLVESFVALLRTIEPDVVHFHHFLSVGADLIGTVRRTLPSCRILFTFHEFAAICAADGHMVRRTDQSLCERASPVRCHQCVPQRSTDDFVLRKLWLEQQLRHVDRFTCPSHFMIEHYVNWGLPRDRISHVTNGQRSRVVRPILAPPDGQRKRFGFFGQLHDDKGVHVLLRAVTLLREEGFNGFRADINGGGIQHASHPIRREIEAFQEAERQRPPAERIVSFNGPYSLDQIQSRMMRVDWAIVPSVWWEIFGLVISEAWMFGRPVICSNAGGMAERVTHEVDGLHFEMGDPASLAAAIKRACLEDGLWQRLHDALPEPPSRAAMADGYLALYQAEDALAS